MSTQQDVPSASQGERPEENSGHSLQNCEGINFCCLSHPGYEVLLWQLKQASAES